MDWRGQAWSDKKKRELAIGMGYVGLRVERYAKGELYKGHGVITGTLRRSIHTAPPSYDWAADAHGSSAEGQLVLAELVGPSRLVVSAGSGLEYAKAVHDGHHAFGGYHYMTIAVDKVRPEVPGILKEHTGD